MAQHEIGNYKIIEKLGEGGMGEVFKGLDIMLEREVAIKLLRPELSNRKDIVDRFRTEAVALARLNHTNIATLYSFSLHENQYFMVLEFVRGESLAGILKRRGAIPWREATHLICQALDGLEHAHRSGVIHRDIKPANIMLTVSGTLKLMDFGIARILETARMTKTGHLIGTLEYMSPEQIQGKETDERSDIYSVGVVFFELVTGRVPFEASSDYELIKSQVEDLPPRPRSFATDIPPALEQVILRALDKRPENRFQSASMFRSELLQILGTASGDHFGNHRRPMLPETRIIEANQTTDFRAPRSEEAIPWSGVSESRAAARLETEQKHGPKQLPTAFNVVKKPKFLMLLLFVGVAFVFISFSPWRSKPTVQESSLSPVPSSNLTPGEPTGPERSEASVRTNSTTPVQALPPKTDAIRPEQEPGRLLNPVEIPEFTQHHDITPINPVAEETSKPIRPKSRRPKALARAKEKPSEPPKFEINPGQTTRRE